MAGLAELHRVLTVATGRALDLALPGSCAGCGREGPPLCPACRPALDVRRGAAPGVALGLPADLPAPLLQLEWCAPFNGVTRRALLALKYGGEQRLARPLGGALAARWRVAGAGGDVLVPVPASPDRVRRRGYDQAALLAGEVGRHLGLPMREVLVRSRTTAAQFDLDRAARGANVHAAFAIRDPLPAAARRAADRAAPVAGAWVVLIDDVVTTGATLAACAAALLEAGALAVSALTVARER